MASVARFIPDPVDLEEEIKRRDDHAESRRRDRFIAARRIQAWIRGILTRNHFRLLHESSITIQRHWRGYRVRIAADLYLVERVHQMWQDHYDRMATRIQAIWRGYWVRKTVLDLPRMRRWLTEVYAKNEETVKNMRRFKQDVIEYIENAIERESLQWILFILFKLHHLLGTRQRPGVITRLDKTRFTLIEEMLRCFEYRRYGRRKRIACRDCRIDGPKPSSIFRGTYYERCEKEIREIESSLQAGITPIFRSQPYEESEKSRRETNRMYMEASLHGKYEKTSICKVEVKQEVEKGACSLRKEFESRVHCQRTNELYDEIKKMDCHLNRLRLKCPVHVRSST